MCEVKEKNVQFPAYKFTPKSLRSASDFDSNGGIYPVYVVPSTKSPSRCSIELRLLEYVLSIKITLSLDFTEQRRKGVCVSFSFLNIFYVSGKTNKLSRYVLDICQQRGYEEI